QFIWTVGERHRQQPGESDAAFGCDADRQLVPSRAAVGGPQHPPRAQAREDGAAVVGAGAERPALPTLDRRVDPAIARSGVVAEGGDVFGLAAREAGPS